MEIGSLLLPLFLLWALGTLLLLLRKEMAWAWKISALLVFAFYCGWMFPALKQSYEAMGPDPLQEVIALLKALIAVLPVVLLVVWPVMALVAYFTAISQQAERIVRNLVLVTLFYWVFWFVCLGLGLSTTEAVDHLLPNDLHLPELPAPPSN
ncbi:MAG: hypothetical protein H7A21_03375 [Spirochaetales bacterium]|nr:hypothetical protein [Leptospiraceae bacterium]MCP5480450.1 hypothetical protein [Spirochaetales bacterium]